MDVSWTWEWRSLHCPSYLAVCVQVNYLASLSVALEMCELEGKVTTCLSLCSLGTILSSQ